MARARGVARVSGIFETLGIAADGGSGCARRTLRPRRTNRWQVSPRRRVLFVTVRAVGPGRATGRQEFLLRHGAPPGSGYGT
jgi:hypothetical protein